MIETNTAGSAVAAVLETAGYFTQAQVLEDFYKFFLSGGALLYLLALLGATASVAIYGSFRMARYLLVGPGLLYFLVFYRTEVNPVEWKIGGELAKPIDKYFQTELLEYVISGGDQAKVSWFFAWYTNLISRIMNSLSDVILKDEFASDLLFITREQVFRLVISATVQDQNTQSTVIDGIMGNCEPSTSTLLALADERFSQEQIEWLWKKVEAGDINSLFVFVDLIMERLELVERLKVQKEIIVNPGTAMRRFVRDRALASASGTVTTSRDYREFSIPKFEDSYEEFAKYVDEGQFQTKCESAWIIALDALRLHADHREKFIYKQVFYNWKIPLLNMFDPGKLLVCEAVVKKLYGGDLGHLISSPDTFNTLMTSLANGGCSLADAIALFMLRNILINESSFSDASARLSGSHFGSMYSEFSSSFDTGMPQAMPWGGAGVRAYEDVGSILDTEALNSAMAKDSYTQCMPGAVCTDVMSLGASRKFTIAGQRDEMFNKQLESMARSLMQQIFNYATQLPYWQGVLLYLLSIAYPFFAIVVVLPNRASAFFYIPLAWMWVKSWDVGFAIVRVFDEISWELMPGRSLIYGNITEKVFELGEAMTNGIDPGFYFPSILRRITRDSLAAELYQHYFFLSVALWAVPAVTGMMILRGRYFTLASFTEAAQSYAIQSASKQLEQESQSQQSLSSSSKSTSGIESGSSAEQGESADLASGALSRSLRGSQPSAQGDGSPSTPGSSPPSSSGQTRVANTPTYRQDPPDMDPDSYSPQSAKARFDSAALNNPYSLWKRRSKAGQFAAEAEGLLGEDGDEKAGMGDSPTGSNRKRRPLAKKLNVDPNEASWQADWDDELHPAQLEEEERKGPKGPGFNDK